MQKVLQELFTSNNKEGENTFEIEKSNDREIDSDWQTESRFDKPVNFYLGVVIFSEPFIFNGRILQKIIQSRIAAFFSTNNVVMNGLRAWNFVCEL